MEEKKEPRKAGGKKTLLTVLILLAVVAVAGVLIAVQSGRTAEPTEPAAVSEPTETEVPTVETTESTEESHSEEETIPEETYSGYVVETPVGTVYYPEEWTEFLAVEEHIEENLFQADFCCELSEETVCLFSLTVGAEGKGYLLGTLEDHSVWMDVCQIEPQDSWSEEETTRIFDMQNRVNDILDQVYHLEGFQKNAQ